MATQQLFLVNDNSTAANFKAWAKPISDWLRTCGWTNSSDTGQLNGAGAGNWAGVSTVPGSGAYYYEIFQPGDGLQTFYVKLEYGNVTGQTNTPSVRLSIGTSTNGAGTLTGLMTQLVPCNKQSYAPNSTATYECDFCGDSGKFVILMWRASTVDSPLVFAVQRSLNASGAPYGTSTTGYVTLWAAGSSGANTQQAFQQSLHFQYGPGPYWPNTPVSANGGGWPAPPISASNGNATSNSLAFAGSIPIWNMQPCVGVWDYPCTVVGVAAKADLSEGVPFSVTNQYGQTKTYIPTRSGRLDSLIGTTNSDMTLVVEYD